MYIKIICVFGIMEFLLLFVRSKFRFGVFTFFACYFDLQSPLVSKNYKPGITAVNLNECPF